jgi:chorismate mutase
MSILQTWVKIKPVYRGEGMERIIDLNQSRQVRQDRQEQFRSATEDLMDLLEKYRNTIPEEFMTFLLALAVSEQAIYYANKANTAKAGQFFLEHLSHTAEQLFEIHLRQPGEKIDPMAMKTTTQQGQVVDFSRQSARQPE